jgi:hypothetical protein
MKLKRTKRLSRAEMRHRLAEGLTKGEVKIGVQHAGRKVQNVFSCLLKATDSRILVGRAEHMIMRGVQRR